MLFAFTPESCSAWTGIATTQIKPERIHPMSTREQLIEARLGVLALVQELENISRPRGASATS
jgi:hypothetical protein